MKIIDAYFDLDIRKGVKKYLLAQGMSIGKVDNTYKRFGVYLSRLKSVNFDKKLQNEDSLDSFLSSLRYIFEVQWVKNINYVEMPHFFYWYTDYLQTVVALDPSVFIEGLSLCISCQPLDSLSNFETPYISNNKLTIITNPKLIVQVSPILKNGNGTLDEAISIAKNFYGNLLPNMDDSDWGRLLMQLWPPKTKSTRKATTRNIEIKYPDGTSRVYNGNDAMFEVATIIGIQKLCSLKTIKHRGNDLVTRVVPAANILAYKELENGWYLNLLGNNEDKFKTIRLLNAICSLKLDISITTAEQTSERKTSFKIILK